jgi:UDP-glucose 6-dehydrogenase
VNVIGLPGTSPRRHPVRELYEKRFPGTQLLLTTSDESEAAKLGLNTWFAVKVSWFNELKSFCDAQGCDFETVRRVILADGRTTTHHTQVPGPDGKRGFGGTCLPKDLAQFIEQARGPDCEWLPVIADAALRRNRDIDRGEHL